MRPWGRAGGLWAFALLLLAASGGGRAPASGSVAEEEVAYGGGLGVGWQDLGWAPRQVDPPGPARLRLDARGGWILYKPGLGGPFEGLRLRFKAPAGFGEFLEVRLDASGPEDLPRVRLDRARLRSRDDGWTEAFVPMEALDPKGAPFDRVVVSAFRDVGPEWVLVDRIALTGPGRGARRAQAAARTVALSIDCTAPGHPISPLIYGIGFDGNQESRGTHQWELGATARRWGGNPSSRFNWRLGNAWNTGNDYFFRNVAFGGSAGYSYDDFLQADLSRGVRSALTVPMLGWVARDRRSVAFPVSRFGPQQAVDPSDREAGNGLDPSGRPLTPDGPTRTSVEASPDFIGEWVRAIREKDHARGRSVDLYILDNEPMLWSSTHRDVHPAPVSYDELLSRTIAYGTAVRRADPEAVIAGPAEWGWTGYFYSGLDTAPGAIAHPDFRAHGRVPLLVWYLRQLRAHERRTGVHLLDVVDVHFYPQCGVGAGEEGGTDPETSARRIRSTRALWDPSYRDESWIDDRIELIPRLKRWIAESYPGRGIAIGEYNFGAAGHMSGGLAQAEALGRFAEGGVTAAFYWQYPPRASPTYWAFRAYRDFDGRGGHFLERYVPATAGQGTSLFASRDEAGTHLVAVALNLEPSEAAEARLALNGCGRISAARVFGYAGEPRGFAERAPAARQDAALRDTLPPYSITVYDISLVR